jgi:hypothetical protein
VNEVDAARLHLLDEEARYAALLSAQRTTARGSAAAIARWVADAKRAVDQAKIRLREAEEDASAL